MPYNLQQQLVHGTPRNQHKFSIYSFRVSVSPTGLVKEYNDKAEALR